MALNELMHEVFDINQTNGWFDKERPFSEDCALLAEEVAEAFREYRHGHETREEYYVCKSCGITLGRYYDGKCGSSTLFGQPCGGAMEPKGVPSELIDVIVRALDSLKRAGITDPDRVMREKLEFNRTRGYRHGGLTA